MSRRAPLAAINITPLVDVLLILVATLLLLAPELVKRLPVDLPRTSLEGQPHLQQSLLVTIDSKGQLAIDGSPLSKADVISRITVNATTVEIAAAGPVSYETVVHLVEDLRAARPREILLLTR